MTCRIPVENGYDVGPRRNSQRSVLRMRFVRDFAQNLFRHFSGSQFDRQPVGKSGLQGSMVQQASVNQSAEKRLFFNCSLCFSSNSCPNRVCPGELNLLRLHLDDCAVHRLPILPDSVFIHAIQFRWLPQQSAKAWLISKMRHIWGYPADEASGIMPFCPAGHRD